MRRKYVALLLVLGLLWPVAGLAEGLVLKEELGLYMPDDEAYKISVVFANEGKETLGVSMPQLILLNKAGETLENSSSLVVPLRMAPGESSYFSTTISGIDAQKAEAIHRHELVFEEAEAGAELPALDVTLLTALDQLNEEEGIRASFVNNSDKEIVSYRQVWVLRDAQGQLIDITVSRAHLNAPIASDAGGEAVYYFGGWSPSLAYCLEKGLATGSVTCLLFGIH